MTALWLVGLCLVMGAAVARWGKPPAALASALHWWIINIALPAITLALVPQIRLTWDLWYLAASQWLLLMIAILAVPRWGRAAGWSRQRVGCVIMVAGLSNTSFLGFPMIEALRGGASMPLAVVADQAGAFLALAVGGTTVAASYASAGATTMTGRPSRRQIIRRVATFPPFLALAAGILVGLLGGWPDAAASVLHRLGNTLSPMALFSVGLQFQLRLGRAQLAAVATALGFKLVIAPAIVWSLGWLLGMRGELLAIATLQAAMAPMVSATIVAGQHDLDPPLANTVLGIGIVLSLVTVPLINYLL